MLTQGYRRFEWKQLLNERAAPMAYAPEVGVDIKGTLLGKDGRPLPNEKISLMLASTMQSMTAMTDANGKFGFRDLAFADKTPFLLNIENKSIRNKSKIILDKAAPALALSESSPAGQHADVKPPQNTSMYAAGNALNMGKPKQLSVVNVQERLKYRSSSLAGAGNADQVIFRKDILAAPSLSQGLTGIARNIEFANGKAYIRNNNVMTASTGGVQEPMLLVVDGAITPNGNIDNYLPGDIDNIEILKGANAAAYGLGAGAGVIVINTRQGGNNDEVVSKEMSLGIVSISPKGFYVAREFYAPVYEANKKWPAESRTAIFWNPNVVTNATGNAEFNYFNEGPGQYRVIVEGVDNAGNIGRAVYRYIVK